MTKIGLVIGTSKLYSMRDEAFLVCCGECDGLFHLTKSNKRKTVKCPLCHKEIGIVNRELEKEVIEK